MQEFAIQAEEVSGAQKQIYAQEAGGEVRRRENASCTLFNHRENKLHSGPFCSLRFCTVEQVTLADNTGHLSASFCVMRLQPTDGLVFLENGCRSHRIETRCCNWASRDRRELRWTHRLISLTNSVVDGVFHGDFDVEPTSQTEALACRCSSRLVCTDKDICDGYVARPSR